MLERLLEYSLNNRMAAFILAAVTIAAGWNAFSNLTVEAFPDPTDTQVQVITLFPGQPAEEVERRVSLPLERALNGTPGLMRLRSISLFALSFVTLTFDEGVDPYLARQQTTERIASAELPPDVKPGLGPLATPIGEVYRYTLDGPGADPMTLRTLQDWTVRPQLLRVQGVADVVVYGGLLKEIHVEPDPVRMAARGVELDDIFKALQQASGNATGGYVERGQEAFVIRSLGMFKGLDDIEAVQVGNHGSVPVLMRDVASVAFGYAPRQGVVSRGDNEDAVEGIVLMRRGQNPSVVLAALRTRIEEVNARMLPEGIKVVPFYDRTELVNTTLNTVFHNLAEGAALVVLVLMVFLLSWRASLIVAIVIPLSLFVSFIYLQVRGMGANLLSMGAVDFGIIVDGAVILVEHVMHRLAHHGNHAEGDETHGTIVNRVLTASKEVARPTLMSLLIIIAAYVPIFSLQRVEGRIFGPMANTVVSALVGALVMSFTLVPVLLTFAFKKGVKERVSPLLTLSQRVHDPILKWSMANPLPIMLLATGALAATVMLLPRLGSEFLPELNEGALYVTFTLPDNMSLTQGRKMAPALRALLRRTPEAMEMQSQLGRPEDGTDATLSNNLEFFVRLKPPEEWRPNIGGLQGIIAEMTKNLTEVPGIEVNFSQPIRDNVNENISGQFGQIAVKIYGDDLVELQKLAEASKNVLADVPGVADLGIVKSGEVPQISVEINRGALARYNLTPLDVQNHLETAMAGHVAAELWEGERRFDVTVRLPQVTRSDMGAIRQLRIPLENGTTIPLKAVASVDMALGRAAITRENGRRYVGLRMNVRGRDMGTFVEEARSKIQATVPLPAGYEMAWGGEFENKERAMKRLQMVIPLALLLTFLLLFSTFGKAWDAALIMFNVPLALLGGVLGLAMARMPLSVSAAVGFIALLGQAVLNGVLVVSSIRERLAAGEPMEKAAFEGTRDRLRPVLMTALLASLGLVPAAFSHGIGSETQRPIAVVVVAGTVSAALLTLVVLPVTYQWGGWLKKKVLGWLGMGEDVPEPLV